jgi:nucleoside-triphosphatase THEP1
MSCGGLFCPARFDADRKIAIDVVDVRDGERHPLAALSGGPDAIVLGPWRFDPAATAWARARLERACPCDLLLVDEIGPLEMDRGQGWPSALDVLRSGDYGVAVVVVRPSLVDAVRGALSAGRCVTPIAGSGPRFVADALAAVLAPWSG